MPRFASMIKGGMLHRGHSVDVWTATSRISSLGFNSFSKKWFGYIDQYVIFPFYVKRKLKSIASDTLFVFADQALGPWIPLVQNGKHIIHCHDFLATASAMGEIPENKTGFTGRAYQNMIRKGFSKGKNFISVSEKTRSDLHRFLGRIPRTSEVVYNGLNQDFKKIDQAIARKSFGHRLSLNLQDGYVMHIGGNMWYKNRKGVIDIYNAWREVADRKLPLLMIGEPPTGELLELQRRSPFSANIHWVTGLEDQLINMAYSGATVLVFPSLGEGFGWPIAEAMASGCPVITTDEAPMNEVAGNAGLLIPRMPSGNNTQWATKAAKAVDDLVNMPDEQRQKIVLSGLMNAERFNTERALDRIEEIYRSVLAG